MQALATFPGNVAAGLAFMQRAAAVNASLTCVDVENVKFKLQQAFPAWFFSPTIAACVNRRAAVTLSNCSQCGGALERRSETRCFVLTYASGKVPAVIERWQCRSCDRLFAGCWSWPRNRVASARLTSPPGPECLLTLCPNSASIAAIDGDMFRFMTASLLHLRSAFRGFAALLVDFHGMPDASHLHDDLLHAWLVYFSIDFLKDSYWAELSEIEFCIGRTGREEREMQNQSLRGLHALLQRAFLRQYAQDHTCVACLRMQTLAFDGKVNSAVPVCCKKTGTPLHMLRGDVLLDYGCLRARAKGSFACAYHHTPASVCSTTLVCGRGHRLRRGRLTVARDAACSLCETELLAADVVWRCDLRCAWLVCHDCATSRVLEQGSLGAVPGQEMPAVVLKLTEQTLAQNQGAASYSEEAVVAEVRNPCGLVKGVEPGLNRYYGNTLAALLSCGRVAFVIAIAGHESLTQVYGMLAAVCTRRQLKFVVYDNACALARFVRGLARRRSHATESCSISSSLRFVLDRWHEQNHTACLNARSVLYMPEVRMDQYMELQDYDSNLSEIFNAWLELFVPSTRHMLPATFDVYLLLLAVLWNERVASRRSHPRPSECHVTAAWLGPVPILRHLFIRRTLYFCHCFRDGSRNALAVLIAPTNSCSCPF